MHGYLAAHTERMDKNITSHYSRSVLLSASSDWKCYGHLGPPTFFLSPTLSTVPLLVECDDQQWRDLLRDLGPVCRQWCSKHCLLKAESTTLFPFYFTSFQTYLYHHQHDYSLYCFLSSHLHPCVSMITSSTPLHNHAYYSMSFLLILTDIASLAAFSLQAAL